MPYATADDVQARLGRDLDAGEVSVVEARLNDAELLIRSRIRDLDERIADGEISVDAIVMVQAEAVLRLVRNPDGKTTETDGNYSYQVRWDASTGRIAILDDEWRLLGVKPGFAILVPDIELPGNYGCAADPRTKDPDTAVWG